MYIESRLNDNDARTMAKLTNEDISPTIYHLLRECPLTSISVERSFSMLKKLHAKDRNSDLGILEISEIKTVIRLVDK